MSEISTYFNYLGQLNPKGVCPSPFSAATYFQPTPDGLVHRVNRNFYNWFMVKGGKTEHFEHSGLSEVPIHSYESRDGVKWTTDFFQLLGGTDSLEIPLRIIYEIACVYANESTRPNNALLSVGGFNNCFYARDRKAILRRVIISFSQNQKILVTACEAVNHRTDFCPTPGTRFFSTLELK